MAYDELVVGKLTLPPILEPESEKIKSFMKTCQSAALAMLSSVSSTLGSDLSLHHRSSQTSDTALKLIAEPSLPLLSSVGENKHTDSGTFTILFYEEWGLHIKAKGEESWSFAAPKEGCALVNVADSLERLSGGMLHSPTHRVTQPRDGAHKRFYLSYFLRPEHALKAAWARET